MSSSTATGQGAAAPLLSDVGGPAPATVMSAPEQSTGDGAFRVENVRTPIEVQAQPPQPRHLHISEEELDRVVQLMETGQLDSVANALRTWQQGNISQTSAPPKFLTLSVDVTQAMKERQKKEPQKWSMTLKQWIDVFDYCMLTAEYAKVKASKRYVNMYDINTSLVKPWSKGTGCGIAVLLNKNTERSAELMMSHAWGEDIEECRAAIAKYKEKKGLDSETIVWFCLFANYQPGDGFGPSIAEQLAQKPFKTVLDSAQLRHGMVAIHTTKEDLYLRLWCVHEIDEALAEGKPIGVAMSDQYVEDVVRRLKVYLEAGLSSEECLHASAIKTTTIRARCGNVSDEEMIIKQISSKSGGFSHVDSNIEKFRRSMLPDEVSKLLQRKGGTNDALLMMSDLRSSVRMKGIELLAADVGSEGDLVIKNQLFACLRRDNDTCVVAAAIRIIPKYAMKGDQAAGNALVEVLRRGQPLDPINSVIPAVLDVVPAVFEKGERTAVALLCDLLSDLQKKDAITTAMTWQGICDSHKVYDKYKWTVILVIKVLDCLGKVAEEGDADAIDTVRLFLKRSYLHIGPFAIFRAWLIGAQEKAMEELGKPIPRYASQLLRMACIRLALLFFWICVFFLQRDANEIWQILLIYSLPAYSGFYYLYRWIRAENRSCSDEAKSDIASYFDCFIMNGDIVNIVWVALNVVFFLGGAFYVFCYVPYYGEIQIDDGSKL